MFDAYAVNFTIDNTIFPPAGIFPTFGSLASDIVSVLMSVAFILSIFFIIFGGIRMVTAGGDPKKLAGAGDVIKYAIIGLAVTILAFVILQVVQYFLQSSVLIN